jgi:uncharacterized repeat protein (TIGR01451 family)
MKKSSIASVFLSVLLAVSIVGGYPLECSAQERVIQFAGRNWTVRSAEGDPGGNHWSASEDSVWVDDSGMLHLKLREVNGTWYCAEVVSEEPTQYGMHRFYVITKDTEAQLDDINENVVVGLFLYKDDEHEIDIEFARWGQQNSQDNTQYVVQPFDAPGNLERFQMQLGGTYTTHYINWGPSQIDFKSIHGHHPEPPNPDYLINEWSYDGSYIPQEEDNLHIHINLWLYDHQPPTDQKEVEIIIADVDYPRTGGPDSFGYTYSDSNCSAGPTYNWIEISSSGTEVLPSSDDEYTDLINMGFFFNYYGTDYTQIKVGNNGLLFEDVPTSQYVNQPITQTPSVHGFIAPFWDDIVTWGSAGSIYYQTVGEGPNRRFAVEWKDNQHYHSSTSGITFEAILYEGSNNILFQYQDVNFGVVSGSTSSDLPPYDYGGSATVGIEDPTGDVGLQYSFNEQVINPGLAVLFKFPQFAGTNLFLSKQAPASKDRGSAMTYTLHYHNFGDTAAQNVALEDSLPAQVEFVSASDGGVYDSGSHEVTWDIGDVPPLGHAAITLGVRIPSGVSIGTIIENNASISTSNLEVRYDDNEAHAQTRVTGSSLPLDIGVEPNNGGSTPSVYWHDPITYSYYNPTATGVDIRIHINDGGPDITGTMTGGPPEWTYTTTFYPRHGRADVTYTVNDPAPYFTDFDLRSMRCFENTITAGEIEDYIRTQQPESPMLDEVDIAQRFVDAGLENNVNPAFLVATAEHESQFGTQGWAATYPEAHNAMGYGITSGGTPPNDINSADSWGEMVERVAWAIAHGSYYYTQDRYTVDEIRQVYAADPASQAIANYMNALAEHAGQAGEFDEDFNIYIDPAGYVYDVVTGLRIDGATVWLQRPDGVGGWENVPSGELPPLMQPDANPLVTDINGQYQWDVLEGSYRVHVEAAGYYSADSIVVSIPPPVTDLHVGLTRILLPPVANANGPYFGYVGFPVTFNGTGSHDLDGTIVSYEWDLDDDGEFDDAIGPTPSKTWDTAYSGNISLKVIDNDALQDTDFTVITVEVPPNQPPIADAGPDQTVCVIPPATTAMVTLNGSGSYDENGDPLTYNWTWDGNTVHGVNPTVELLLGTITITLVVNDGKVDSEPDTVSITVNSKPIATASSNSPVSEGDTIELYGGPDGMTSYNWTGPGGWTSPSQNATRLNATVAMAGNYTLMVTNEYGCTGTNTTYVEVMVPVVPQLLKQDAISNLEVIEPSKVAAQRFIDNSSWFINKSLADRLWVDDSHLCSARMAGAFVFDMEKAAVLNLKTAERIEPAIEDEIEAVIDKLTEADKLLCIIAINDAKSIEVGNPWKKKIVDREILRAEKQLEWAYKYLDKDMPAWAITYFKLSWIYAQRAINFA